MKGVLPNSITIYGKKFKVVQLLEAGYAGMMDYDKSRIYINSSAHKTDKQLLLTFWHEIFHAFHYRLGLHQALSAEILEILAESQATLIVELFY
jgi:Zn-dependent peptidase ImmA (M78 family)